jgi:DNA-binding GntR family transcriptional regulator
VLESIETQAKRWVGCEDGIPGNYHINTDEEPRKTFGIQQGDPVIRISRVIWVADRPVAYLIDNVLPDVLEEERSDKGFTGSVLDLFPETRKAGTLALQNIGCRFPATTAIAKKMQLPRGDCPLRLEAYL